MYYAPKQQQYSERYFLNPTQRLTHKPDVNLPENIEADFPEGQVDKEIETNAPNQEDALNKNITSLQKSIIDSLELRQQINTSKVLHTLLSTQTYLNNISKVIERKLLKGTHIPMTISGIQVGYLTSPYFKNINLYLAQKGYPLLRL